MHSFLIAQFLAALQIQSRPIPVVLPYPIVTIKKTLTTQEQSIIVDAHEPQIGTILVTQGGRCFFVGHTPATGGQTVADGADGLL